MDDRVNERFNCNAFVFVPATAINHLENYAFHSHILWGNPFEEELQYANSHERIANKMIISPALNGYTILEGQPITLPESRSIICRNLSLHADTFFFEIDHYTVSLIYQKYAKGMLVRDFQYLVEDNNKVTVIDTGTKEPFENDLLYKVERDEEDLHFFWFPVRVLETFSITQKDLLDAFSQQGQKIEYNIK